MESDLMNNMRPPTIKLNGTAHLKNIYDIMSIKDNHNIKGNCQRFLVKTAIPTCIENVRPKDGDT